MISWSIRFSLVVSLIIILLSAWADILATAFVSPTTNLSPSRHCTRTTRQPAQPLHLLGADHLADVIASSASLVVSNAPTSAWTNFLVATIDSDIANVPENEFAPIFAGGILVMFGGVLSALIVGFILESRNLYANVIADSYAQGAEDEEFWKGLSDEEKKKTQELLQKLKESKEGTSSQSGASSVPASPVKSSKTVLESSHTAGGETKDATVESPSKETSSQSTESKDAGMFSDY